MYLIYKATSPSNKVYIGLTSKSLKERIGQHESNSRASKVRPFAMALKKYELNLKNKSIEVNNKRSSKLKRAKSKGGKPFICNETGEIFQLLQDAADKFGVDKRSIHKVLKYPKRNKTILKKYTFNYVVGDISV